MTSGEPIDLTNCDREPIHIPGSIQPHGALLAFKPDGTLALRSVNADALLGPLPAIGATLTEAHLTERLRATIALAIKQHDPHEDVFGIDLATGKFDIIFSKSDGLTLVECEQYGLVGMALDTFPMLAQRAIDRVQRQTSLDELLETVVHEIHSLTAFDRVMAYRFLPDESGEVVAERKRADLETFVGQRYPAGDIPAQARRLFVLNPLRVIADVGYTPIPIAPQLNPLTQQPLDLSRSVLRSVSPIHVEYLTNMGVAASMSISIVVNGALWGMVACHHMSPHLVPRVVRMSCQLLSQIVSVLVERTLSQQHAKAIEHSSATRLKITERAMQAGDLLQALAVQTPGFADLIACDGGAVTIDGRVEVFGQSPTPETVLQVIDWLEENDKTDVFATDSIGRDAAALNATGIHAAGMLCARFHRERSGYIIWFRNEQIESVRWAGNPQKVYATGPLGSRLTPRGSFLEWKEEVKGKSSPWLPSELQIATQVRTDMQEIALSKSTLSERARDTLFAMLGHDLRDPLQAIMMAAQLLERQTEEGSAKSVLGKRIVNSGSRMKRLISEVLDVSRIQNGLGLTVEPAPTDIAAILNDLVRETVTAHPALKIEMDSGTAGIANVDPDRLGQVLSNLLSNARHHGEADKPISLYAGGDEKFLKISVANHGQPIDAKVLPTLFDPFKSGYRSNRKNPTGLGLGLYIVNEIIRGHNGTIEVRCVDGKVIFEMVLPR